MKKLLLLLLLSLGFISSANAAVPPYITADTFENICRKVNCSQDLSDYYYKNYYVKQFHKAVAISYSKSGNRYSIDYVYFTWEFPNSVQAKSEALKGCRKSGRNCEIFLVNNSFDNADLYDKLTNTGSTIPANAHQYGSGWICNQHYYKSGSACRRVPANAYSTNSSNLWHCNPGYEKNSSKSGCISINNIPANAHQYGSGWICNQHYYKSGSACRRVPANAYSTNSSNLWHCNSGYEKNSSQNACVSEDDLTVVVIIIILVVVGWIIIKAKTSGPTPVSSQRSQPKPNPKPQPKPSPKPQPKPRRINVEDSQTFLIKIGSYDCTKLKIEFKKWNDRINQAKTEKERKDIQKIIDFIGKVRNDKDC